MWLLCCGCYHGRSSDRQTVHREHQLCKFSTCCFVVVVVVVVVVDDDDDGNDNDNDDVGDDDYDDDDDDDDHNDDEDDDDSDDDDDVCVVLDVAMPFLLLRLICDWETVYTCSMYSTVPMP